MARSLEMGPGTGVFVFAYLLVSTATFIIACGTLHYQIEAYNYDCNTVGCASFDITVPFVTSHNPILKTAH